MFTRTYPKPYLFTHSLLPENQETPIHFLRHWLTPEPYFYLRNHFPYPALPQAAFTLPIDGLVNQPVQFSLQQLMRLSSKTIVLPLECSGNKRAHFRPKVYGDQWVDGALSQGAWTGVPLQVLLNQTGYKDTVKEVVFEGYDCGPRTYMPGIFSFARSLPLEQALHPDTIVAYALNGKPIPYKHGYPLRLIVPGWYGMAHVKWLKRICLIDHHFQGPFQDVEYNYYPHKDSDRGKRPVTFMKVNSLIQCPLDYSTIDPGLHRIYGLAWSGTGTINKVNLSFDNGKTWKQTTLWQNPNHPYAWSYWYYDWSADKPGEFTIMSRAHDSSGQAQPLEAEWNRLGYGYNAVYTINVKVD